MCVKFSIPVRTRRFVLHGLVSRDWGWQLCETDRIQKPIWNKVKNIKQIYQYMHMTIVECKMWQTRGQKSFNLEKAGGLKNFLNLNTMSRVLISIITNSIDSQIIMPKR
jgi:hypothetical protein